MEKVGTSGKKPSSDNPVRKSGRDRRPTFKAAEQVLTSPDSDDEDSVRNAKKHKSLQSISNDAESIHAVSYYDANTSDQQIGSSASNVSERKHKPLQGLLAITAREFDDIARQETAPNQEGQQELARFDLNARFEEPSLHGSNLEHKISKLTELQTSLNAGQKQIEAITQNRWKHLDEYIKITGDLAQTRQKHADITKQLADVQNQQDHLKIQETQLDQQCSKLKAKIQDLLNIKAKITTTQKSLHTFLTDCNELNTSMQAMPDNEIQDLASSIGEEKIQELFDQKSHKINKKFENASSEFNEFKNQRETLQQQNDALLKLQENIKQEESILVARETDLGHKQAKELLATRKLQEELEENCTKNNQLLQEILGTSPAEEL